MNKLIIIWPAKLKAEIGNPNPAPVVGDVIIVGGETLKVTKRIIDYDKREITIYVEKEM